MKINYKNTALHLLEKMDVNSFSVTLESKQTTQEEVTRFGVSVVNNWPLIADRFKNNIRFVTNTFYVAYTKGLSKLRDVLDREPLNESGTFIVKASDSETNTIFYDIHTEGKGQDYKITGVIFFFNNSTSKPRPSLVVYVQRNAKGIKEWLSVKARENDLSNISVFADLVTMILFLRYCELETKLIKPEKKDYHVGVKYLNETKLPITVLDSTWFTTIIRSDGFTVGAETGGFFRMQPCGKDHADRRLIWISPFEKEGYTRKAKILTQNQ